MSAQAGDELVEVIDEHGRVVATVTRREMRAGRLRHRTVAIVVTASDGRLLVHRRSEDKDVWPGRWDVAVGGVLAAGEDPWAGARRELAEEVGVEAGELVWLADLPYEDDDVAERVTLFTTVHDGPYVFADGEVVEARLVDTAALDALRATERFVPDSLAVVPLDRILGAGDGDDDAPWWHQVEHPSGAS